MLGTRLRRGDEDLSGSKFVADAKTLGELTRVRDRGTGLSHAHVEEERAGPVVVTLGVREGGENQDAVIALAGSKSGRGERGIGAEVLDCSLMVAEGQVGERPVVVVVTVRVRELRKVE